MRFQDRIGRIGNLPAAPVAAVLLLGLCTAAAASENGAPQANLLTQPVTVEAAILGSPAPAAPATRAAAGQLPGIPKPVIFALRLGALLSPRLKFDGGADMTFPLVHVLPDWQTRVDADAIVSGNFGGISTLVPITFDQIYSKGLVTGTKVYGGFGAGMYIADQTRFGGKVLVGANLSQHLGAELDLHWAGVGPTLVTLQLRTPF